MTDFPNPEPQRHGPAHNKEIHCMRRSSLRHLLVAIALALPLGAAVLPAAPAGAVTAPKVVKILSPCGPHFCFSPGSTSVVSGGTVQWVNKTTSPHTVTRCTVAACKVSGGTGKDAGPKSPTLAANATYKFTFHGKGTYVYYCAIHGYAAMHGKVTVT